MLPSAAKYAYSVIGIGIAVFLEGLYHWTCPDWKRFLAYIAMAMAASALKVRLPKVPGTLSLGFLFVLMSLFDLSYSESLALAAISAIVQCLWRAKPRPSTMRVAFNIAMLMVCIAVCQVALQLPFAHSLADNLPARFAFVTCIFFALNSLFFSGIIAITEGKDVGWVWRWCFLWSFPYYLVGAALAGVVVVAGRVYGWRSSLLAFTVMIFVYLYYRIIVKRHREPESEPV